ncbi:hypothetical protein Lser_V15G32427 [Lactuca serriola]
MYSQESTSISIQLSHLNHIHKEQSSWVVLNRTTKGIRIKKPDPWNYHEEITREQFRAIRSEFWQHVQVYGGRQEIWDALRRASEALIHIAQAIVDSLGIIPHVTDLRVSFDNRGKYKIRVAIVCFE